jgi:capsular exopolysaccharide synthesis family protein
VTLALFGLLSGLGLADLLDRTSPSLEEICGGLDLPVLGQIPSLVSPEDPVKAHASGVPLPPTLWAYWRPQSAEAEAFRRVRTALLTRFRGADHQVLQVTSPEPETGKTTLAVNLAISLVQTGQTVLLVDGDFRRPQLHRLLDSSSGTGLAAVLRGTAALGDALHPSLVPGLSVLPCGPLPPGQGEFLTSPRLQEAIDLLRRQFPMVIIDTPALLAAADPCLVAPVADAVLLVVRDTPVGRAGVGRAREILDRFQANILGVVVNGVPAQGAQGPPPPEPLIGAPQPSFWNGESPCYPNGGKPVSSPRTCPTKPSSMT